MSGLAKAPAIAGALLSTALLIAGCAAPQVAGLLAQRPTTLPERTELTTVPFYPQELYQCGPAALSMVLGHAGVTAPPEALVSQVYLPARAGSLQTEMLATARRHGFVAYRLEPRLRDVLSEVAAGTPVVVLQNLSFSFAPLWHYAVVVGYDLAREDIILRSGTTSRLVVTLSNFEHTWARSGHWAMIALPPERLPASVSEAHYVAAAAALERAAAAAARRAYSTALARWPGNFLAQIGSGNTAYALKDLAAAENAYRQATRDHPLAADAWNNLAQTLFEQGRKDEALQAAQRAVTLGGVRQTQYQATLKAISESR